MEITDKSLIIGKYRISLYDSRILRIEKANRNAFFDGDDLLVRGRAFLPKTPFDIKEDGDEIVIDIGAFCLRVNKEPTKLSDFALFKGSKLVYKCKKFPNSGILPPLEKTPAVFPLFASPRVIIPSKGYGGKFKVKENVTDLYLLLCDGDFALLRKLYRDLTLPSEMVRRSHLGLWQSRYFKYDEESAKKVLLSYSFNNLPMDVFTLDTDWRKSSDRGIGYEIDDKLFPDMKGFIHYVHSLGKEIMFNDHPEPVRADAVVFDKDEMAYRKNNLTEKYKMGLDIWWYDRNWLTILNSPTEKLRPETFGNYLYRDIAESFNEKHMKGSFPKRPIILCNALNALNGRFIGALDSSVHIYSACWTGDNLSSPFSLAMEVNNLIEGGNSLLSYIHPDCGGHLGQPDDELYARWFQFGCFCPILRVHASNLFPRYRDPFEYGEQTLRICRDFLKMRYNLIPLIYAQAHESYLNGSPVWKETLWNYQDDKKAKGLKSQYMLGRDILIAPIASATPKPLEKRHYVGKVKISFYEGEKRFDGKYLGALESDDINFDWTVNPPLPGMSLFSYSAKIDAEFVLDEDGYILVFADDKANVYVDGELIKNGWDETIDQIAAKKKLSAGIKHVLHIDYYQGLGGAYLSVMTSQCLDLEKEKRVYLPKGLWIDAFSGDVIKGGRFIIRKTPINEMPLYIKGNSIIPLIGDALSTKKQDWSKLTLDCYLYTDEGNDGFVYEDDGQTIGYQKGEYAKWRYSLIDNVIRIGGLVGGYDGFKANKEISIKLHVPLNKNVSHLVCNGQKIDVKACPIDSSYRPLSHEGKTRWGKCYFATVSVNVGDDNIVEIK